METQQVASPQAMESQWCCRRSGSSVAVSLLARRRHQVFDNNKTINRGDRKPISARPTMRGRGNRFSGGGVAAAVTMQCMCQGKSEPVAMASKQHQHSNIWGGRQQATVDMVNNNQLTVMVTGAAVGGCVRIFSKANRQSEGD